MRVSLDMEAVSSVMIQAIDDGEDLLPPAVDGGSEEDTDTTSTAPSEEEPIEAPRARRRRARGLPLRVLVAEKVKAQLGELEDNEANRLVVTRKVMDALSQVKGIRNGDRAKAGPVIVELVLTPSVEKVVAQQFRYSNARAIRLRDAWGAYRTHWGWVGALYNWVFPST